MLSTLGLRDTVPRLAILLAAVFLVGGPAPALEAGESFPAASARALHAADQASDLVVTFDVARLSH